MAGIKKIKVPLKKNELSIDNILLYMPTIIGTFNENARNARNWYDYYKNVHTSILAKERPFDDQADINNIVQIPHLWAMVNFKAGYAFGNPIEYAQNKDEKTNDIVYLNKYDKDSNKRAVDKELGVWIYSVGTSYSFIEPKDISETIDPEWQSPYNLYVKPVDTCAKIYSSYNGEAELFDILVTTFERVAENGTKSNVTLISVYTPDAYFEFEQNSELPNGSQFVLREDKTISRKKYKKLPLTEKFANESRIGIVELGKTMQDALDRMTSNSLDNIEEVVNQLLIFRNCLLGKTQEEKAQTLRDARKCGGLEINDKVNGLEADVKQIANKLQYSDLLNLIIQTIKDLYDTNGVPIPSSDTSNGGNKQGAMQIGNGWDSAYNRLLDEINSFLVYDYKLLEKQIFICKSISKTKIDELNASDIEIKYNPNMTDNMLVKAQAYNYYTTSGVPHILAMSWCRTTNDPITSNEIIQKSIKEKSLQNQSIINNSNSSNIDENPAT